MLTPTQVTTLKAFIIADPVLSAFPTNIDGAYGIADLLNKPALPDFNVWATNASTRDIFDAINWEKFTPNDPADGTAIYTNRVLLLQTKQMNLQNMLMGRDTVDGSRANIRIGLRDAVTGLPSGNGGSAVSAGGTGGATILTALLRNANLIEKILSPTTATSGTVTAALLGYEGSISPQDVEEARK